MMLPLLAALSLPPCALPQEPAAQPLVVALTPVEPGPRTGLKWSPKGAKVPLHADGEALVGEFALGPTGAPPVRVRLAKTTGSEHFDRLQVDRNRDGEFGDDETLTAQPKPQNGKWWSSFDSVLSVPFAARDGHAAVGNPYPMSLWFVVDPQEPDAEPNLRWSRRGYHEGTFEFGGRKAFVLVTEMAMDGVFTNADSWALAYDEKSLLAAASRELGSHCWLEENALRAISISPDGRELRLEPFDPHTTRAAEEAAADEFRVDREAKRAATPLAFGKDLAAALATAKQEKKRVLVDFVTTWCGPCKLMDEIVYGAADVVAAASGVVCVKLDGDAERELVRRYQVAGYPTILLLDADGTEVRRAVGYQSVARMVRLLAK